jgi:hypothetical protein
MSRICRAALAAGVTTCLAFGMAPLAAAAPGDPTPFTDYGIGDSSVTGLAPTAQLFFPITPGVTAAGPAVLDLDVSHSPLLLPELSSMTVVASGTAIASARLTPENADHGRLQVAVPATLVAAPGLFVEVRFGLRLTDDDCEDPTNPALWATVHSATSRIAIPTTPGAVDLADLQAALTGPGRDIPSITLPSVPGAADLEAAGAVAAQIGRWQGLAGDDALVALGPSTHGPEVVVGEGPTAAIDDADIRRTEAGVDGGLIATATGAVPKIYVVGATDTGLRRAAAAFADPVRVAAMRGRSAIVSGARPAAASEKAQPWTKSAASFAQLGIAEQVVTGAGSRTIDVVATRPPGWKLDRSVDLELRLDAAPGLKSTSSFTATANGFDIGTRRLKTGAHTYRFTIAGGILDRSLTGEPARALRLRLDLRLHPDRQRCVPSDGSESRVALLATSAWFLRHNDAGPDLGRFPAELSERGKARVVVVVPDDPTDWELAAGLEVCAAVGRWQEQGAPAPLLVTADAVTEQQRERSGFVLVGDADADLGEEVSLGDLAPIRRSTDVVGYVGLIESPFSSHERAVVIHGEDEGLFAAARALGSGASLGSLRGTRAVVTAGDDVAEAPNAQALRASDLDPPSILTPEVKTKLVRGETIAVAVLLAALVLIAALVIRFRWWHRRSG